MTKLILIKLGGSVITDKNKPYTAREDKIRNFAGQIKTAREQGYRFLISHGSGSFGHTSASKYKTAEGIGNNESIYGLAVVQQDAISINRIVNKIFLEEGLPVLSFIPSSFIFADNKELSKIFTKPVIKALEINALPLVFGDVILDEKRGCCIYSGETTLDNLIEPLLKANYLIEKVIQVGNTNGVYDEKGQTIPEINENNFPEVEKLIKGSSTLDVTGGMLHKIQECLIIAKKGISCYLINGEEQNSLLKTILGQSVSGTLIKE